MSARDRLAEALKNPGLVGYDEEGAAELIDAFAHELAEQQRAWIDSNDAAFDGLTNYVALSDLADLIDPTKRAARPDEEPTT